jgi:hypothetical protein
MKLEELKEHVDKLQQLLADPHPGLFTWIEWVAHHCKAIAEFYYGDAYEIAKKTGGLPQ